MTVTALEEAGYEVIEATSGGEALRLLQAGITVDALMTDIRLPKANGGEAARAYRKRFPGLPVLYVPGYAKQMQPVPGETIISESYRIWRELISRAALATDISLPARARNRSNCRSTLVSDATRRWGGSPRMPLSVPVPLLSASQS
ncbi:response regulator [Microvirga roseola]|uniref:response regulator n=1 Tax=Microvirga roseola TaxID=2883126 RepID=UPI00389927D4